MKWVGNTAGICRFRLFTQTPYDRKLCFKLSQFIQGVTIMPFRSVLGLIAGLIVSSPVFAATFEDCMDDYQEIKDLYAKSVSRSQLSCSETGDVIKLYATAAPPYMCIDEDEWNLDARAVGGENGSCSIQLLGTRLPGCGADKVVHELQAKDAEKWMNFIRDECDK